MAKLLKQLKIYTGLLLITAVLVPFGLDNAATIKDSFPKRANYFLSWELSNETANELSKMDLVIIDMEHQIKNKTKLIEMKKKNPNLILLAYITSQEIRDDATSAGMRPYTPLRYELANGITDSMWLKNSTGGKISWWPGTHLLNISSLAPTTTNNPNWNEYLAQFVTNKILSDGIWDGVFFDNTWNSLTEKVGANLDLNLDGEAESRTLIESSYKEGMNKLFNRVNQLTQNKYILMGNDGETFITLNGMLFENFPSSRGWTRMMQDYTTFPNLSTTDPRFAMINANTANKGGADNHKLMRFGLASSLLGNGYYSFDFGDRDHGQTWWYDEYDTMLGQATNAPYLAKNHSTNFAQKGLWRRDFQNGLVLVNSGDTAEFIDLNGEYEKIKGPQDPTTNSGLIISSVTVPANDGLILLRPVDKITNTTFTNGAFLRFYNSKGNPTRNGFFAYDNRFRGGASIYLSENNNATLAIIADKNQIKIYNNDILTTSFYPFGANYKDTISLTVNDLNNDGQKEIIVGMNNNGTDVKIFDLSGKLQKTFTAFLKNKQGVNVAVGNVNGGGDKEIIVSLAKQKSAAKIFSKDGKAVSPEFYAFGKNFKGGANIAAGDINGDGKDEIIFGATTGKPEIRIFNEKTKQVGVFLGGSTKTKNGIKVTTADVDNNSIVEIIAESTNVFTASVR